MNTSKEILFDDNELDDIVIEIPKDTRKITTQAYDKSVSDIIRMISEEDIRLDPEYQRHYIWDNKKASLLIESFILNVPIPVVYVSQEEDDTWTVIDGLQRLTSLFRFFNGEFKLRGLEILTELNNLDHTTLPIKSMRILKNGLLRIIMISNDSHPEIKYDIFMRLNTGSIKLNDQELRNCLFRGSLNEKLKDIVSKDIILSLFRLDSPHARMADRELILRLIALLENFDSDKNTILNYKGKMKTFINTYMSTNRNMEENRLEQLEVSTVKIFETIKQIYTERAFCRLNEQDIYETSLNRALMDMLFISTALFNHEDLIRKSDIIFSRFKYLTRNDIEFKKSITQGTSDTKVLNYRISTWITEIKNIINGSTAI